MGTAQIKVLTKRKLANKPCDCLTLQNCPNKDTSISYPQRCLQFAWGYCTGFCIHSKGSKKNPNNDKIACLNPDCQNGASARQHKMAHDWKAYEIFPYYFLPYLHIKKHEKTESCHHRELWYEPNIHKKHSTFSPKTWGLQSYSCFFQGTRSSASDWPLIGPFSHFFSPVRPPRRSTVVFSARGLQWRVNIQRPQM